MKHTNNTTPRLPGMGGLAFGGVQLRPMDTGKGGWDLFRPVAATNTEQPSIWATLDACEDAELHGEPDGYDPDEGGNCRRCGEAGRCHCGQA